MNIEDILWSEVSRPQKANPMWLHLFEVTKSCQSHKDRKYNSGGRGLEKEGNGELLFSGCGVLVLQDEECSGGG